MHQHAQHDVFNGVKDDNSKQWKPADTQWLKAQYVPDVTYRDVKFPAKLENNNTNAKDARHDWQ